MKLIKLILICSIFISCAQTVKNNTTNDTMKDIRPIPKEERVTYSVHINARTPYEIYIDDIPLPEFGRYYETGMNTTLELNPYLLSNGMHKLKVRYLPLETATDSLLHPGDVYHNKDVKWSIYFVNYIKDKNDELGYKGEIDYTKSALAVVPPPKAVPFWEQEFDIEIKDLPYTNIGWSKSQDLSKVEDEDKLKEEVFEYFNYIRDVLDQGKIDEYIELNKIRDREVAIATYEEEIDWSSDEVRNELINDCKGNMWEIDKNKYLMKIFANGKIATIERIDKFKNQGLIAETETDYWYYGYMLHKPIGSDTFQIIR